MEGLTDLQSIEVTRQIIEINKSWWFFSNYFWILVMILGGLCIFYYNNILFQSIGFFISLYCVAQLSYRVGFKSGYVKGYESGLQWDKT